MKPPCWTPDMDPRAEDFWFNLAEDRASETLSAREADDRADAEMGWGEW